MKCKTCGYETVMAVCPKCYGKRKKTRKGWDRLATTKKHGQRRGDSLKDL